MAFDNDQTGRDNIQRAIDAGMVMATPTALVQGHALAYALPQGATVKELDIEKYLDRPTRKRGTYAFEDAKSFVAFVNREKTDETVIFASRSGQSFTAVFNGNEAVNLGEGQGSRISGQGEPGWGDYKATFNCPLSPEWKVWTEKDGDKMSQVEFATFIDDNAVDIIRPTVSGTDVPDASYPDSSMMQIASRTLEARNDVSFASAVRLNNGEVQFKYEETINGAVQGGMFEVPQKFAVGIPVYAGTAPWLITAKLRYRIERGGLSMWFDFERLFKVKERAFDEAKAEIASGTGVPIFLGAKGSGS